MKMRPFKQLISLEEALALISRDLNPLVGEEMVKLDQANGRVLVKPLTAKLDVPGFDRAAMDGYAVRAEDSTGANEFEPRKLELLEVVHAGQVPTKKVISGSCSQIATGALMPDGTDGVVMVEQTREIIEDETTSIEVLKPIYTRQNVSERGSDIRKGDLVLKAGWELNAARIGVMASLGLEQVTVRSRPRVAIMPTGSEVVPLGRALDQGEVYDSNTYTLEALVTSLGGESFRQPILPDEPSAYRKALIDLSRQFDLLIIAGGSSVGERDLLVGAVEELGQVAFHGVAIRPGKPVLWGYIEGTPVLGLPGYPTSCLVTGHIFLTPILTILGGRPEAPVRKVKARLTRRINSVYGRTQFHTVKLSSPSDPSAPLRAEPVFKGSGALTSLSQAQGLVVIRPQVDLVEQDTDVEVLLL